MSDDELLASIRECWARLEANTLPAISDGSIQLNGASRTIEDRDH
jgi:hypothetical protein